MTAMKRKLWLERPSDGEIVSLLADLIEDGRLFRYDPITRLLDKERFKERDHGQFPEDEPELVSIMKHHCEIFATIMSDERLWRLLHRKGGLTPMVEHIVNLFQSKESLPC